MKREGSVASSQEPSTLIHILSKMDTVHYYPVYFS
jgi:hypothetical protein